MFYTLKPVYVYFNIPTSSHKQAIWILVTRLSFGVRVYCTCCFFTLGLLKPAVRPMEYALGTLGKAGLRVQFYAAVELEED